MAKRTTKPATKKPSKKKSQQEITDKQTARSFLLQYVTEKHPYFKTGDLRDTLFEEQRKFIADPSRFKSALCSRRAGKSRTGAVGMIEAAKKHPGSIVPYIAMTRQSAKNIMWPTMVEMNHLYQLGMTPTESALEFQIPTSGAPSKIFMIGADQKGFIDRLRGPKYPRAVIDEAGHFGSHIESLVDDVLGPATADYSGDVWALGTPGPVPVGYFYDITTNPKYGFSNHHWTILDNPFFPNAKEFLQNEMERKNWDETSPTYVREWLGQWAHDKSALIYKLNDWNIVDTPLDAKIDWHYVLGVDVGWHDKTAFALIAYSTESPVVRVTSVEAFSEMIPSEIGDYILQIIDAYHPTNIVMDTGGLGKSIAEEMRKRFGIPVKAAEKKEKMANIELFNGDLQRGMIEINSTNTDLINQMNTLQKADNGLEDPNMPNDQTDAILYSWRECKNYIYQEPIPKLDRDSNAYMEEQWEKYATKMNETDHNPTAELLDL